MGLPLSSVSSSANSSIRASSRSAIFHSIRPRSRAEYFFPQSPFSAAWADWTARSTSPAEAEPTSEIVSSVAGFSVVKVLPHRASTHCPPIHSLAGGSLAWALVAGALTAVATSHPLELRGALGDVGVEPFLGVRALEQLLLQLALDGETALERHLGAGLHGALDPADRLRGPVGRAELLGVLVDLAHEVVAVQNLVDDADLLGLLEGDEAAGDHEVDGQVLAHPAGQALGAAGAGEDAQVDLGQADLAGVALGDEQVRGHGDLQPAAHGVPFERRDDQLGGLLQAVQGLVGVEAEVVLEVGVRSLQHVDVGPGAEELLPLAVQHQHIDVLVEAGLQNGRVELAHHLVGIGIGGWVVQGDVGDSVLDFVVNQGALSDLFGSLSHRYSSSIRERGGLRVETGRMWPGPGGLARLLWHGRQGASSWGDGGERKALTPGPCPGPPPRPPGEGSPAKPGGPGATFAVEGAGGGSLPPGRGAAGSGGRSGGGRFAVSARSEPSQRRSILNPIYGSETMQPNRRVPPPWAGGRVGMGGGQEGGDPRS